MAQLDLNKVWITNVGTATSVAAWSARGRTAGSDVDGNVKTYAGGRQRAITSKGTKGHFTFKLRDVTLTQYNTLTSWLGQTVCVRDHRGRRWFGVYFGVGLDEATDIRYYDVSIVLNEITYQEA